MITHCMVERSTYWRAFNFARELMKKGHKVTLIATAQKERIKLTTTKIDGVTVVKSPNLLSGPWRTGWDLWDIYNRIKYLKNRQFDIIHAFESRPAVIYPALFVKKHHNIPLLFDWADWFGKGGSVEERSNHILKIMLRPIETYYEEHFRRFSDGITVICSVLHDKAIQLGIPPQRVLSLANGSDTSRFFPLKGKQQRVKYSIPSQCITIGYVGSIFKRDAKLLCEAFSQLERINPEVRLVIIGKSWKLIKQTSPELKNVIDLGYVPDRTINESMNLCDIYWFPFVNSKANQGRWPLKFNDIIAVGKPIISTNVGDIAEVIRQEKIGLITQPTSEDLVETTLKLIKDEMRIVEMGSKARHLAETKYKWESFSACLSKFYIDIVNEQH